MDRPLVSIVIAAYNHGKYLPETIESVLAQSYCNLEIILVDDGSTDNTRDIAKSYPVEYVYQENHGASHAFNVGIKMSHGEFYVTPGADDKLHQSYVNSCIGQMLKHDRAGFIWTSAQEFGITHELRIPDPLRNRFSIYRGSGGQLGAALFRRKAFEDVGGYDEALPAYEDWDLAIRMVKNGWTGFPIMEPLYFWRRHTVSRNTKADKALLISVLEKKYPRMKLYSNIARFLDFLSLSLDNPQESFYRLFEKSREKKSVTNHP